jgi:hypothetical protein
LREASLRVGSLGSGAGATGLGSSSAGRLGAATSAVVGSGESVLAIVDVMDLGVLMAELTVEVEVEVAMTDYLEPRNSPKFHAFSTSGSQVNFQ